MGQTPPLGVVLAGGSGRRLGGSKATTAVAGRPLISYPLAALGAVLPEVVVLARRDTVLPELAVPVWIEPDGPRHPLRGLVFALERAAPRAVLVCALDLVAVTPELVRTLAEADGGGGPATIVQAEGRLQPLLGRYEPRALAGLRGFAPGARATDVVRALNPRVLDVEDADQLRNVNTPQDVADLEALISRR